MSSAWFKAAAFEGLAEYEMLSYKGEAISERKEGEIVGEIKATRWKRQAVEMIIWEGDTSWKKM